MNKEKKRKLMTYSLVDINRPKLIGNSLSSVASHCNMSVQAQTPSEKTTHPPLTKALKKRRFFSLNLWEESIGKD